MIEQFFSSLSSKKQKIFLFSVLFFFLVSLTSALVFSKNFLSSYIKSDADEKPHVLAETSKFPGLFGEVTFNIPAVFNDKVTFNEDVKINNKNLDLGTGSISASNIIYSLRPGANISITGDRQNPTISASISGSFVTSLQGQSGAVTFVQGTGITIDGLTITNSDPGSAQNIFKTISVEGSSITAGSNNDTLQLAAGTGISLSTDGNKVTITNSSPASGGGGSTGNIAVTQDGTSVVTALTTLDFAGSDFTVTQSPTGEANITTILGSSINLASSEVTGILPVANGGTGATTLADLIALGTDTTGNYLAALTGGSGISVTGGSGEGATPSLALGALTSNWDQTGAFDIILNNASSELQILESTGGTFYGTIDVGNLSANRTYTFPDGAGTVCILELGNCGGGGGGNISGSGTSGQITFFNGTNTITSETTEFSWDGTNKRLGLGTDTPGGKLHVTGASTGQALAIFNETGNQNIIAASASGTTRMTLDTSGNLNIIGGAYQIGGTNVLTNSSLGTGVLSSSLTSVGALSGGSITSGFGTIATNNTITGTTLNGTTGLNTGAGAGTQRIDASGNLTNIAGVSSSLNPTAANTYNLGTGTGNQYNSIYGNSIFQNGNQVCDTSGNCTTTTYWDQLNGALRPKNSTVDLLVGGQSSASAKFALLNVNTGTPTASVSAGAAGAVYLAANGTLQTTANQTLTFGGNTTGNITLSPLNGSGTVFNTGTMNLANGKTYQINGVDVLTGTTLGSNILNSSLTSVGALASGSITTGFGTIATNNTITGTTINGTTGLNTGAGAGTQRVDSSGNLLNIGTIDSTYLDTSTNIVNLAASTALQFNGTTVIDASRNLNNIAGITTSLNPTAANTYNLGTGTGNQYNTIYGNTIFQNGNGVCDTSGNCAGGAGGTKWQVNGGVLAPLTTSNLLVLGGNTSTVFQMEVNGKVTGKSLVSLNETGNQNILTASASGTTVFNLNRNGNLQFSGNTSALQTLTSNATAARTYTLPDGTGTVCLVELGNCAGSGGGITGSGTAGQIAFFNGAGSITSETTGFTWDATNNKLGIGTDSPAGKIHVAGASTGQALAILNETGDQNIVAASASGTTVFILDRSGNLALEGQLSDLSGTTLTVNDNLNLVTGNTFQINNTDVLSATALGTNVITSSLTSVGVLNAGSITSGFGTIDTGDTITGTTINGTTGINTGAGAGTQRIDSSGNLANIGTITASGLISANGGLTVANGQNLTLSGLTTNNNSVLYTNGSGTVLAATTTGNGQCLMSNGAGAAPTWGTCPGSSTANYWQLNNGAISPFSNTLDLLVGGTATTSAKFAVLNVNSGTPTASVSAGASGSFYIAANGTLATTAKQSLTLGGADTGNIVLNGFSTGIVKSNASGVLSSSAVNLASSDVTGTLAVGNGGTGATTFATNGILYGNGTSALQITTAAANSVLVTNGSNVPSLSQTLPTAVQDNITRLGTVTSGTWNSTAIGTQYGGTGQNWSAVAQGAIPYFNGTGTMTTLGVGTAGQCLMTNGTGANPSWGNCSNASNYWQLNNGSLSPFSSTADLLVGGTATGSAKFAFMNVNSGTPTASVSAGAAGASYLTADGKLATTARQTLMLGDSTTTGNIILNPAGNVGIGTTIPTSRVEIGNSSSSTTGLRISGAANLDMYVDPSGNGRIDNANNLNLNFANSGIVGIGGANGFSGTDASLSVWGNANFSRNTNSTTSFQIADNATNILFNADTSNRRIGINTLAPTAALDVRGSSGTLTAAIVSAQTAFATMVVNNTGVGDLFTASSSGTPRFTIANNGNLAATGTLTGLTGLTSSGTIQFSGLTTNGGLLYTNGTGTVAQTTAGSSGQCLTSNGGGAPTWSSCAATNYWQLNNGALSPFSNTLDLLVGGTSTSSAKFAVTNMTGSGTPTASVSAGTSGAAYLDASGKLATTAKQTLTLGDSTTTGNIIMNPSGVIGIGTTSLAGNYTTIQSNADTNNTLVLRNRPTQSADVFKVVNSNNDDMFAIDTFGGLDLPLGQANFGRSVGIGTPSSAGQMLRILTDATTSMGLSLQAQNGQTADLLNVLDASLNVLFSFDEAGNLRIGAAASTADTGKLNITGAFTGKALAILNETGNQDIFTASSSGTTRFTIGNNGNIAATGTLTGLTGLTSSGTIQFSGFTNNGGLLYTNGTGTVAQTAIGSNGQCLLSSGGGAPTWGSCGASNTQWNLINGSISPIYASTVDLLVGGVSTSSAKFAVTGINGNATPFASVSATIASGGSGNGITLGGDGSIQSLMNNTLVLGGSTTGNISLTENTLLSGNFTQSGSTTFTTGTGQVTLAGNVDATNGLDVTNANLTVGGANFSVAQATGDITTAGDLTVNGGDITSAATANLLNTTSTTINFAGAATTLNIADSTTTKTIDLGGVTNSGTDTINIATEGTAADTIAIGNSNASTLLSLTGGDDWSLTNTGLFTLSASATQTTAIDVTDTSYTNAISIGDNNILGTTANIDFNNFDVVGSTGNITTAGDLAVNGDDITADSNLTINATGYVRIGDTATPTVATGDDDLFVEGDLEVDGVIQFDSATITLGNAAFTTCGTLGTSAGALTCSAAGGTNWDVANGTISPKLASTLDLLIGGNSSASAKFKVSPSGTSPTASISANTSQAGLLVDNRGSGDLFAASSSGLNRFVVKQNGNVGIGNTMPDEELTIGNSGSTTDQFIHVLGQKKAGLILEADTDNSTEADTAYIKFLQDGSVSSAILGQNGNAGFDPEGTAVTGLLSNAYYWATKSDDELQFGTNNVLRMTLDTAGKLGLGTNSPLATLDIRGQSGTLPVASISGQTSNAALMVDNSGVGDIFTASSSGLNRFVISQQGDVGIGKRPSLDSATGATITSTGSAQFTSISGMGLTDCDGQDDKLLWDAQTKKFSCGADRASAQVIKSANQNVSSSTLTNDSELTFSIAANEKWIFQMVVVHNQPTNYQYAIAAPSGATCVLNANSQDSAGAGSGLATDGSSTNFGCGTTITDTNTGTSPHTHFIYGEVSNGVNAGSITFQFARSGAGTATTNAGSYLIAFKVTGADVAEAYYSKDQTVGPGDVVRVDGSIKAGVQKTNKAYDSRTMGIISTKPGVILADDTVPQGKPVLVALNGRVPVKIASNSAAIKAGDLLTTSDEPGKAMKATKAGQTIAKALEDWTPGSGKPVVMAFVNLSSYDPDDEVTDVNDLTLASDPDNQSGRYRVTDSTGENIVKVGRFSDIAVGNLKAGGIDAQSLSINGINIFDLFKTKDVGSNDPALPEGMEMKFADLTDRIGDLEQKVASNEAKTALEIDNLKKLIDEKSFAGASNAAELQSILGTLDVKDATMSGTLNVLGRTTVNDLGVTGNFTAGVLSINGLDDDGNASINTLGGDLKLQSAGVGGIDILAGKIKIDKDGTMTLKESLTAKTINTTKLNIIPDTTSTTSAVLSTSAGSVTIEAGKKSIEVSTTALTPKSLIFVTPDQPVAVGSKPKDKDTFIIQLSEEQAKDVKVNWWIVN